VPEDPPEEEIGGGQLDDGGADEGEQP